MAAPALSPCRRAALPSPAPDRVEEAEDERPRRRTKGPGLPPPPLSPPPVLIDLTLSLERWGDWERAPRPLFTYRRVL